MFYWSSESAASRTRATQTRIWAKGHDVTDTGCEVQTLSKEWYCFWEAKGFSECVCVWSRMCVCVCTLGFCERNKLLHWSPVAAYCGYSVDGESLLLPLSLFFCYSKAQNEQDIVVIWLMNLKSERRCKCGVSTETEVVFTRQQYDYGSWSNDADSASHLIDTKVLGWRTASSLYMKFLNAVRPRLSVTSYSSHHFSTVDGGHSSTYRPTYRDHSGIQLLRLNIEFSCARLMWMEAP